MIVYLFNYQDDENAKDAGHLGIFTSVQEGLTWLEDYEETEPGDKLTLRVNVWEVSVDKATHDNDLHLGEWFYDEDGDEWVRSE